MLLGVAGVWLLCQVLGGQALQRLGIVGTTAFGGAINQTARTEAAKHVPASAYPSTGLGGS